MPNLRSLETKVRPHLLFWPAFYLIAKPLTFLRIWTEPRAIEFLSRLVAISHERRSRADRRRARRYPGGGLRS